MITRTYSELIEIPTFEERFQYLSLQGVVGARAVLTLEEGTETGGWGAEVLSVIAESQPRKRLGRVASPQGIIPCGRELEIMFFPTENQVVQKMKELLTNG